MHGQLHFRAANSDLRGSAGVLRLLLFNRGGRIVRLISSGFPTTFRKKRTSAGNKYYYKSVHSYIIKLLNLGIAKETKIGVDLCEPCDRGDRNFDVASLGEGNHGGGEAGLEEYRVSSRSHGCDNGGSL